jgi:hypothetical protein
VREFDLLRCVDEFCEGGNIGQSNWAKLATHYDDQGLLEFTFLCTQYRALSSMLEILGVEPDTDGPVLPELGAN